MTRLLMVSLITLILFGCSDSMETNSNDYNIVETEIEPISIDFAENFTLNSIENGYELELIDPNTQKTEAHFVLTYDKSVTGKNVIHLPVENIACLSQTSVGMLTILSATDFLTGISNINYVHSAKVKEKFENKEIVEFGDESNYPLEKIIQSKSEVILYSGFGKSFPHEQKLLQLNISPLPIYDWRESHPLGKAEWIKFIGVLTGKVDEANDFFNEVKNNYIDLSQEVLTSNVSPTVFSGNMLGDIWYAPAGGSYMAMLFTDAGATYTYRFTRGTGSIEKSLESVLVENRTSDFWLNPGVPSKSKLIEIVPQAKNFDAFQGKTYCYTHDSNKFWERSAAEPNLVLSDLIHIFHPEISKKDTLDFYQLIGE